MNAKECKVSIEKHHPDLAKAILAIPGEEGWWKSDAETFFHIGWLLLEGGATPEFVEDILGCAYYEVASEYGV